MSEPIPEVRRGHSRCAECERLVIACVCGMTFAERLRSTRLSTTVTPTRTKRHHGKPVQ